MAAAEAGYRKRVDIKVIKGGGSSVGTIDCIPGAARGMDISKFVIGNHCRPSRGVTRATPRGYFIAPPRNNRRV